MLRAFRLSSRAYLFVTLTAIAAGSVSLLQLSTAKEMGDPLDEKTGGNTTVYVDGQNAFSFPAANLQEKERTRFVIGNSFFRRNWVEAPSSTQAP